MHAILQSTLDGDDPWWTHEQGTSPMDSMTMMTRKTCRSLMKGSWVKTPEQR